MKGTIKSKEDIERLFQKGRRSSSSSLTIIALESIASQPGRCAFIAGKKLGTAPFRNRCKRVLRQVARELNAPFKGYDVVFMARRAAASKEHESLKEETRRLLEKLCIL